MSRIWHPPFWVNWAMLSYYLSKHSEKFSTTFSVIYDFASFWHPWGTAYTVYPNFIIFRIKTAVFGCAPVSPNGRASHEISNKKQCFQHVRPSTFRTKFHYSSMAMMTCQLSPCERYHPVRRRWNHFIIYKSHPSTWCLRLPMGSKIFLAFQYSLPIQDVTRHMWAPQNRRISCNRDLRRKTSRQVLEV